MVDQLIVGHSRRLAQEGPIPIHCFESYENRLGGCANVLMNIHDFGLKNLFLFSMCGSDASGEWLRKTLDEKNIQYHLPSFLPCTTTKRRYYEQDRVIFRSDKESIMTLSTIHRKKIIDRFSELIEMSKTRSDPVTHVVFSDYGKGYLHPLLCRDIITMCQKFDISTFVDAKYDFEKFSHCTLLKPNLIEAAQFVNKSEQETFLERQNVHTEIHQRIHCDYVLMTCASHGISMSSSHHTPGFWSSIDDSNIGLSKPADVTGAGDVVLATVCFLFVKNFQLRWMPSICHEMGKLSVLRQGTTVLSEKDVIASFLKIVPKGVIHVSQMTPLVTGLQQFQLVVTNGCFDILHAGHWSLLQQAKKQGTFLVVALNSDQSITSLKGPQRPILSLQERIENLYAIDNLVDFIIVFDTEDQLQYLLSTLKPHVLVKGADYTLDDIQGSQYATHVSLIPFVNHCSSSSIIHRVLTKYGQIPPSFE